MKSSNGRTSEVFAALHRAGELPAQLEGGMKAHPFQTAAVIAGVSFLGGALLGSRVARAVLVAATPALVKHLLDGPFGDDITRYVRGAIRGRTAESRSAS